MASRGKDFWNVLLGLAVLLVLGWGVVGLGRYLISVFVGLNPNVAAAIVAAFATVVVSVLTVIVGKRLEAKALIIKEHREKKTPVYEEFIQFWFKFMLLNRTPDKQMTEDEMVSFLSNYTQKLMVWGSDEVVAAWVRFRYSAMNSDQSTGPPSVLECHEKLVLAIRKDLGHKNKGLRRGDMLRLFVNDLKD